MEKIYLNESNICTHFGENYEKVYKPISPAIVQTSTFKFDNYESFLSICDDEKNSYMYTRGTNPTTEILERKIAKLECGERCKVFASGMAAISSTLLSLLESGDHILSLNIVYGQANGFMKSLKKYGIEYDNIKISNANEIENHIKENTKIIYMESPSSQLMELLDLEAITEIAKSKNILTIIDNTWATPVFQKPIKFGVDIVIHSCSKYISGNSDVVAGAVVSNAYIVDKIFEFGHQNLGAVSSPFNSWLLIRGLRTLPMRMMYQQESTKKVIDFLLNDPRIEKVNHPMCGSEEQKKLSEKYLSGYSSLLSFVVKENDFDKLKKFVNGCKIFQIGVSWGGHESLILPAYKGINDKQLEERKMSKMHVRLYVGIEDPDYLVEDLKQALDKTYGEI